MTKQEFWNAFEILKPGLEQLLSGETKDYTDYNTLSDMLVFFNEHLVPEITGDKKDGYTLIISRDGFAEGIPVAEESTEGVSKYANWKIVKYTTVTAMRSHTNVRS
ncbi:MAG TPA: hypothetical protein VFE32_21820 [Puia sp.]|nr:hypothetical protein [Puia sp.]